MTRRTRADRPTFLQGDGSVARALLQPLSRFMQLEAASGIVLLLATVAALVWANSPFQASYHRAFHTPLILEVGRHRLAEDLAHWIDDALMAVFFFVVGMEIKREWAVGELQDRRAALLPAVAAAGGMVVPALIYFALTAGGEGARGSGIPMATDIAFALGLVAVLGRRVPAPLKVFLLTLAIVDDIGAIVVIAIFYSASIDPVWLAGAAVVATGVWAMRRLHIGHPLPYVAAGLGLWLCTYRSGVHATLAGVVMGLLTPAAPTRPRGEADVAVGNPGGREAEPSAAEVHEEPAVVRTVPETDRLIGILHPWTSFVIVPLFALGNAGIELRADSIGGAGPVLPAVVLGLVVGKTIGITVAAWLLVRVGAARLPSGVSWGQLTGVAALAGIGFTVSLFVAGLAFDDRRQADAKVGILIASVLAAAIGSTMVTIAGRRRHT